MEVILGIFLGTVLEHKNGTPGWLGCGQESARMRMVLDPARTSPPSAQISYRRLCRMSCRKGLETPLAAGLAASAGGLGSLEALAVHPWAQEVFYAAI